MMTRIADRRNTPLNFKLTHYRRWTWEARQEVDCFTAAATQGCDLFRMDCRKASAV
jgi:hypothetical protein